MLLKKARKFFIVLFAAFFAAAFLCVGGVLLTPDAQMAYTAYAASSPEGTALSSKEDVSRIDSGAYYLAKDIALDSTFKIAAGKTVTLDLNGYMLAITNRAIKCIVSVNGGLTLLDSYEGTGRKHAVDNVEEALETGATRVIVGGVIAQGHVEIVKGGTFTMNGGSISGCRGKGGVRVKEGGEFIMNGGSILNNSGYEGKTAGGVSGNIPPEASGVDNEGTFTMTGGTITENSSYFGITNSPDAVFNISGSPKIFGNSYGNYEVSYAITIAGELTEGAEIHVQRASNSNKIIATGYTH